MKRSLFLATICLLLCQLSDAAQTMLTLHSKDGSTFSYSLSDKPVVTYNGDVLVLTSDKVNVEYPVADLAKMTFTDTETSVESVTMSQQGEDPTVRIYSTGGTLVKTIEADEANADISFSTKDLPAGIYIIKQGVQTYKIIKQ